MKGGNNINKKFKISITKIFSVISVVLIFLTCSSSSETENKQRVISLNEDWQFTLIANPQASDTTPENLEWRTLNLPHDWSIEGVFKKDNPADLGGGYLPGGVGWYKKNFKLSDSTKLTFVQFDGVYMNSTVWVNGKKVGNHPNGYGSFEYNITPYLKYGPNENEILVKVDNSKQPNSRWYSGSGIYRNVWLKRVNPIYIPFNGTFITTPKVSNLFAEVSIEIDLANEYPKEKNTQITTTIFQDNLKIESVTSEETLIGNSNKTIYQDLKVTNPKLWSLESPFLYQAITQVYVDGEVIDTYKTNFGIRTFQFDLNKGFILNNEPTKIKGVCLHHDLGPLGAAINNRAIERQLEIMKEMGVNGIRTAHNPPAPKLLDLCDKMGFIVMDEAFDMWEKTKTTYDYANYWEEWHKKDLADFIKRDRNHPSIFIWSIGNEIPEQWSDRGIEIAKELKSIVHELDTTRPITLAMNPPVNMNDVDVTTQFDASKVYLNPVAASGVLDLIGYNYAHQTYEYHQKNFPNTPFIATETTSGLQTRGYYDFPSDTLKIWPLRWDIPFDGGNPGNTVSAFDQVRTPWGSLHETTWKIIKKYDYLSGMFIWTGFDYIGEPTPYSWPSRSSYFGIVDLAGFPKDVFYMYQSEWTDETVLHIFPHWNWEPGKIIDIWAYYNNADEVELFINGKSQGIRTKEGDDLHVMWRVPFEKGTLTAISRKDGQVVKEQEIKTATQPTGLRLKADRSTIIADGKDLSFITVEIVDGNGTLVPTANIQLDFSIEGEGTIIGLSNGDPVNHESFIGTSHKSLNGKCLVILQSTKLSGSLKLSVTSKGLGKSDIIISSIDKTE
ncbi:glycoside hydrolase family 2 TIM barrel-domain containing protein [Aegicerativicinus sediminis]|uniref:glycoside hydrolase family 2 TIM barrel-domain containing protein n=1 Tax=Aegicerativicinus sediminis TaxID=2893202 RepID=UPI001E5A46AC|nr:glycoside hydrolase family 2 TIM barrel-domain containing protein [Aegicerativicinus sediminis]